MIEDTLGIIKPDGMKKERQIYSLIDAHKFEVVYQKKLVIPEDIAKRFYLHVNPAGTIDKTADAKLYSMKMQIYKDLVSYMTSGESRIMILRGDDSILRFKELAGNTDPKKAEEWTIRGLLGEDDKSIADAQLRAVRNLIHATGNYADYLREMKILSSLIDIPDDKMPINLLLGAYRMLKNKGKQFSSDTISEYQLNSDGLLLKGMRISSDISEDFSFEIYSGKKSFLSNFGLFDGKRVFEFNNGRATFFEKGDWMKNLESLIKSETLQTAVF